MRAAISGTPSFAEFLKWNAGRTPGRDPELAGAVSEIIEDVRARGLAAALEYARKFDAPDLNERSLFVGEEEMRRAEIPQEQFRAIQMAIERVRAFHENQLEALTKGWTRTSFGWTWRMPAVKTVGMKTGWEGQRLLPLRRVGVYVPGGKASYPSSVIMNAIPAKVAGVEECIVAVPARKDGGLSPAVLVAARETGARTVVKVGGAAAVALLAFGCERFEGVEKVVGPGNRYVNEAKRQLWGTVGLDSYAGPSEVCVVVDETSNPRFAAADLLAQIEHGPDNLAILVSTSHSTAESVLKEIEKQLADLDPERLESVRTALANSWSVVVRDLDEALFVVDSAAPEHLSLMVKDPERASLKVRNAGSLSLGQNTPQSAGDYVAGPSHTIPTAKGARFGGPLNVLDFLKIQSIGSLSENDLRILGPAIARFSEMEGFPLHGRAAEARKRT